MLDLMAANGWRGARAWAEKAKDIGPTIVGGSKKHGGADLGPTRAKRAWRELGVDALGVADVAPSADDPVTLLPKLTCDMVFPVKSTCRTSGHYFSTGTAPASVALPVG